MTLVTLVGAWTIGAAIVVPIIHAICRHLNRQEPNQ